MVVDFGGVDGWHSDLIEFHEAFGAHIQNHPGVPGLEEVGLRRRLVKEEYEELIAAIDQDDLVGIADGAVDLIYVTIGLMVSYGIDATKCWDAVHESNMAKLVDGRVVKDDGGKVLKPEGWQPPNLAKVMGLE